MMTPQELIDLPYAGMAEEHLRKLGKWDDTAVFDGKTKYSVTVEMTGYYAPQEETETYTVIAASEEDAIRLAENMCGFDEITNEEAVTVKEIEQ